MPFTQPWLEVDFGSAYASIVTTGYRLYQATGADSVARTTTGVVDLGNGAYGVAAVNVPDNAVGIEWDTGGSEPLYAREDIEPYRDRDEVQGKLPTNEIMGSSTKSDKDDEIDAVKAVTDLLPNAGALTDIDTGVNNIEAKLPTNFIMGSSDQDNHDTDIDTILSRVDQSLSATESNIRGADADTLETISDQLDGVSTFDPATDEVDIGEVKGVAVTGVGDFKADVSTLAIEANVQGHAADALTAYDPPTKAELDTAETNIIAEVDANEAILQDTLFSGGTVYVDQTNGSSGTAWPKGTWKDPVDNMADALTIAVARNSHRLDVRASSGFTLAASLLRYTVVGHGSGLTKIDVGSQDVGGCRFENLELTGIVGGMLNKYIYCVNCVCSDLSGFGGNFDNCILKKNISPSLGLTIQHCSTLTPGSPAPVDDVIITMQSGYDISVQGMNGNVILKGLALSFGDSFLNFDSGMLEIDSTCTDGTITVSGDCILTDNHGGTCSVVDNTTTGKLALVHGSGSWESASASDWTAGEREQIRDSLGVDGVKTTAIGGQLQGIQADLDTPDQYKANVSALALEANVEGHAVDALNTYDPPTRGEATADKDEIVAEVNENEVKIDALQTDMAATLADVTLLKNIETGRWKVDSVTHVLTCYHPTTGVPFLEFDLKGISGLPASVLVYERVPK